MNTPMRAPLPSPWTQPVLLPLPLTLPLMLLLASCGPGVPIVDAGMDTAEMRDTADDAASDVPLDAYRVRDSGVDGGILCNPLGVTLPTPLVCNGHEALCARSYGEVSFPMAHNAMNSEEERWTLPNQGPRVWNQLELGIRGFMLDTYVDRGETVLCHGPCALGRRPFVDVLRDLKLFMDCNPGEVITLILEAHIDEETTRVAFEQAELMSYLHMQTTGSQAWPTLESMIRSGRRLVVFTESNEAVLAWHHRAYDFMWDTDYSNRVPGDFTCAELRGSRDHGLFLMNHFLTNPVGSAALAEMVNHNPLLLSRARQCQSESGFLPNFISLDFVERGDLLETVETLNGF